MQKGGHRQIIAAAYSVEAADSDTCRMQTRTVMQDTSFAGKDWKRVAGCMQPEHKQAHAQTVKFSTRDVIVESRLPAGTGKSVKFAGPGRVKPKCDVVALLRHELLKMQPLLQSPKSSGLEFVVPDTAWT